MQTTQQGSIQGLEWLVLDGTDTFPWVTALDHPGTAAITFDALTLSAAGTVGAASVPGSSAAGMRRRMLR